MSIARPARSRAATILAVVLSFSLALSLAVQVADPRLGVFEYDDLREGQLEAAGAVVLILVGGVLLGRVRRDRSRRNLLLGAGLLVLAATELFASIATPLADSLARSTFATWTTAAGGVLAAIALAVAAWLPERALPRGPGSVALTLAVAAAALSAVALASGLLPLPAPFERLPVFAADIEPGGEHWALLVAELVTATGLAACAVRLALLADAERDQLWRWLAIALGLASVAFVNYALVPSQFTELLYFGDVFLLLAVGSLLAGAILEITSAEAALVRSAVSTERTRVADELRAGVAQELALIASQTDLFTRRPDRQPALDELAASVERALDESRGAISELARPVGEPLAVALRDMARDVAASAGARVELDLADDVELERPDRAALLRLARDCAIDATRHRGARRLLVELRGGRRVTVRMIDDGRPPVPDALAQRALRERAEALGATFATVPVEGGGTLVEIAFDARS